MNASNKNPAYHVLIPECSGPEPVFEIDAEQQKQLTGHLHRVAPEDKRQPVHARAGTFDSLLGIYPNAIAVGGGAGTMDRTWGAWMGLIPSAGGAVAMGCAALMTLEVATRRDYVRWGYVPFSVLFFLASILFLVCVAYFFRMIFFAPRDLPILFNRRTRLVTIARLRHLKFWKFWQTAAIKEFVTVPWEHLQARSYKVAQLTGEAMRDTYTLQLLWGATTKPNGPDGRIKLMGLASIGYLGWWEDEQLWQVYEHIRRYMEEGGPAIHAGENLRTSGVGKLPEFPADAIAAAGGPALDEAAVAALSS